MYIIATYDNGGYRSFVQNICAPLRAEHCFYSRTHTLTHSTVIASSYNMIIINLMKFILFHRP